MKLSAETQGALQRYGHVAPFIGLGGTCVGIVTGFRLIDKGSASDAGVVGLGLLVSVGATLLMAVLALAGCFVYERVRSRFERPNSGMHPDGGRLGRTELIRTAAGGSRG